LLCGKDTENYRPPEKEVFYFMERDKGKKHHQKESEEYEKIGESDYLIPFSEITTRQEPLIGGKARNLAFLARSGLPVPDGSCIPITVHHFYRENHSLPEGLVKDILDLKKKLGGKVAIRSSATFEDGTDLSMAGVFSSHYISDDNDVEVAIRSIYRQAESPEVVEYLRVNSVDERDAEMGIVVQQLIEPDCAGVLYTKINGTGVLVQYVRGFGERLVDGKTHGASLLLAKRSGMVEQSSGYSHTSISPRIVKKVYELGNEIEFLYGDSAQDVEFAIQDENVYILQSRPMTRVLENIELEESPLDTLEATKEKFKEIAESEKKRLGTEQVILSDSNFSELLPHPTEMDIGIFSYIFTGSDGIPGAIQLGRREMGYHIDDSSIGYMHYVGGRPYFSIAGDALTYYMGIPETRREYLDTLVTEYLRAIEEDPDKGNYPEIGLYLQDPGLNDLVSRYGEKAQVYSEIYQEFISDIERQADIFASEYSSRRMIRSQSKLEQDGIDNASVKDLVEQSEVILEHMRTVSCVDFVKAARLGFYYSQRMLSELRKVGIENEIEVFAQLTQGLEGSEITEVNIGLARAESDEAAYEMASGLIGHYSTEEMLEIRHPRLKDNEEAMTAYVDGIRRTDYERLFYEQKVSRGEAELDFLEKVDLENIDHVVSVMRSAQRYLALRETVKYDFVKEYALLRERLEQLGEKLGFKGGDIYFVYPRELRSFVDDQKGMVPLIFARKQAFENYSHLSLPAVIREQDINLLTLNSEVEGEFIEAKGKFLSGGSAVEGVIVNIGDFEDSEQLEEVLMGYRLAGTPVILAAVQINLGHDQYIAEASGIIIQNAGITSHGAQRARELGTGAIGGIRVKKLKTGIRVRFDPATMEVRKIEE